MLGWRKKREGFEWHEYVRTTILVRRAHRRQKVDEARKAAVDGLKGAGAAAAHGLNEAQAAAAAGLRRAGAAGGEMGAAGLARGLEFARLSARASLAGARRFAAFSARLASGALAGGRHGADVILEPVLARLTDRSRRIALGAAGVAALLASAYRFWRYGIDAVSVTLLVLAVLVLVPVVLAERERGNPTVRVRAGERAADARPAAVSLRLLAPAVGWATFAIAIVLGIGGLLSGKAPEFGATGGITTGALAPPPARPQRASTTAPAAAVAPAAEGDLRGRAIVRSGDTLRIAGTTLRLAHIAAPEPGQTCKRADGRRWRCGEAARAALAKLTRRRTITCTIASTSSEGIASGDCAVDGQDLAAALVSEGHVFAETGLFARHAGLERTAREAARGLWSGEAQRPETFRAAAWEAAKAKAPDGCPIKGEAPRRGKPRYVMPWMAGYDRIQVRNGRGERWFCSEEEARAAGWQSAGS